MTTIAIDAKALRRDIIVPDLFLQQYMPKANGEHVKVYLLLLQAAQQGLSFSPDAAADRLEGTEKDILRSLTYWEQNGLLQLQRSGDAITGLRLLSLTPGDISDEPAPAVTTAVPSQPTYTAPAESPLPRTNDLVLSPELIAEISETEDFRTLSQITQHYFKKLLNANDFELLIRFFCRMNRNLDICDAIVEHCAERKHPTMRYVDKISCECLDNGCHSLTDIRYYLNREAHAGMVIDALGLPAKKLPALQMEALNRWFLQYHFSEAVVREACDRAVKNCSDGKCFPYADAILTRWFEEGVTSLDDIHKKDEAFRAEREKKPIAKAASSGRKPASTAGQSSTNKFNRFEQRETPSAMDEALILTSHFGSEFQPLDDDDHKGE